MLRSVCFSAVILAALLGAAPAQCPAEDMSIRPNEEVQSFLRILSSTNLQERQEIFTTGTEEELRQKLTDIRKMCGGDRGIVLQLLYFSAHANGMEQAMLPGFILERLAIPNAILVEVCLPLLESEDEPTRRLAAKWLSRVDHVPKGGVDFSRYESVLREKKQAPPQGLIRYMYSRSPEAAVLSMSRVYGDKAAEMDLAAKLERDPKDALLSLADRPEWWVKLYVAEKMRKNPELRDPTILQRLERDSHPLVQEALEQIELRE